jgi:hypothetical protein
MSTPFRKMGPHNELTVLETKAKDSLYQLSDDTSGVLQLVNDKTINSIKILHKEESFKPKFQDSFSPWNQDDKITSLTRIKKKKIMESEKASKKLSFCAAINNEKSKK